MKLISQELYKEEINGDILEIFSGLAEEKYAFLLDSAMKNPVTGRYSYICIDPFLIFRAKGKKIEIEEGSKLRRYEGNPFAELEQLLDKHKIPKRENLPPFTGGAVGYFAYDCCRLIEKLPAKNPDDLQLPDICFGFFDSVLAFDNIAGKRWIFSSSPKKIKKLKEKLFRKKIRGFREISQSSNTAKNSSTFTKSGFQKIVGHAKYYIREGDIFQANLSQRLCIKINTHPWELYKRLRSINPSPFAAYLNCGDFVIAGSSPERLVRLEGKKVDTRPIAGTRPRGKNKIHDKRLSAELILNEKERAEHIMLVDLERNDIGRVCEYSTVLPNELMVMEKYSHVIHIVSNIIGTLHKEKSRFDLIKAVFPGGTITGAPKVRCMEIIEELEPVRRGIYTGSIGYLGFNGNMDLNIVIRTFIIKEGQAYVQAGAGIVADSNPEREYYETLHKAEALLKALEIN